MVTLTASFLSAWLSTRSGWKGLGQPQSGRTQYRARRAGLIEGRWYSRHPGELPVAQRSPFYSRPVIYWGSRTVISSLTLQRYLSDGGLSTRKWLHQVPSYYCRFLFSHKILRFHNSCGTVLRFGHTIPPYRWLIVHFSWSLSVIVHWIFKIL